MSEKKYLGVVVNNTIAKSFDKKCAEMGISRPQLFRDIIQAFIENRLKIIPGERDARRKLLLINDKNDNE